MPGKKAKDIDTYIAAFPEAARQAMEQIRGLVREIVPEVAETISYAMPAFELNGRYLVYFAGFKNHIGLYPAPVHEAAFKKALAGYKTGKGSVQLPLNKPMPLDLIAKIIRFLLAENLRKAKSK